jgi:hypothetical protein
MSLAHHSRNVALAGGNAGSAANDVWQGEMQDQPLLTLTTENYPSLEFIQEIPTRSTVWRLEFCDETRNSGTTRRIYRPMSVLQT